MCIRDRRLRAPETRGDLYVKLEAQLPAQLSSQERELFEQLRHGRVNGQGREAHGAGALSGIENDVSA